VGIRINHSFDRAVGKKITLLQSNVKILHIARQESKSLVFKCWNRHILLMDLENQHHHCMIGQFAISVFFTLVGLLDVDVTETFGGTVGCDRRLCS
jgi:hypothetical protein